MARTLSKLKALNVERERKSGRHSDGGGLYLNVTDSGSKSWVFMWSRKLGSGKTKRYEMGLGSYPAVSLESARRRAQECRELVAEGLNPIQEKRKRIARPFYQVAAEYIENTKSQWTNAKHEYQWRQTLLDADYCRSLHPIPIDELPDTIQTTHR